MPYISTTYLRTSLHQKQANIFSKSPTNIHFNHEFALGSRNKLCSPFVRSKVANSIARHVNKIVDDGGGELLYTRVVSLFSPFSSGHKSSKNLIVLLWEGRSDE